MKKIALVALTLLVSASFSTISAGKKKENKKKIEVRPVLTGKADSLSYAAGIEATNGLIPFVQQQYKVDTAYMADFIAGYKEAVATAGHPRSTARLAGMQIAQMVIDRILPGTGNQLKGTGMALNDSAFQQGFTAALASDTTVFTIQGAQDYKQQVLSSAGEQWLAQNAKKEGVQVLPDGLQYKVLVKGEGPMPKESDEVKVVYEGRLTDGTVFDATYKHPGNKEDGSTITPDQFNVGGLIRGWKEALTMMPVGSKWEIYVPQELGYGARAAGQIPPYSTLVFTLELKEIVAPETPKESELAIPEKPTKVKAKLAKRK